MSVLYLVTVLTEFYSLYCLRDKHDISALWLQDSSTKLKSAPVGGLIWRLAIVMSHVVHTMGGVKAAAHLWYEFTQEMRYRWENGYTIPG